MTPLKDTLEVATPVAEATTAQVSERPKPESGHLRADAVSLDVPVKVHGSRVTDVVRGITPHTEPFEEQTSTMIVFPQGGVLRMTTAVAAGQMIVLTNVKTGHDAICRVIKVRAYAQTQSYVELEFTNRQPGYWGVHFAGDAVEPAKAFVPVLPPTPIVGEAQAEKVAAKPASEISWAPAVNLQSQAAKLVEPPLFSSPVKRVNPPAERTVQVSKPESSFVAIGAQEDVQPAAAATSHKKKVERFTAPVASLSMTELRGDAHVAPPVSTSLGAGVPGEMTDLSDDLVEASQEKPQATFGRLAASASLASANTASQKVFGARFDSTALGVSDEAAVAPGNSGPNWFLIATGIAALFVVAAGGAFYFHLLPAAKSNLESASTSAPAAPPAALSTTSPNGSFSQPSASNSVSQTNQPGTNGAAAVISPAITTRVGDATPSNSERVPAAERGQPSAPVGQKIAKVMPDMSAALNAHPVSAQRTASDDADAPSVESGAPSSNGDLQGIAANSEVAPPPVPVPAPARVGGDVQPPKLISTVLPIYPTIAKTAGVEGSVVVEASIGPNGDVVSAKVISGRPILRQAALDALHRWKYQPATLNGVPISVQIAVTIQFHK